MSHFELTFPLRTVSEANAGGGHWAKRHKRHKDQRNVVYWELHAARIPKGLSGKFRVTLIRDSFQAIDSDNLSSAFKAIRDTIADYLRPGHLPGRADSDDVFEWIYQQRHRKLGNVTIVIEMV